MKILNDILPPSTAVPKKEDTRKAQKEKLPQSMVVGPIFTNLVVLALSAVLAVFLWLLIVIALEQVVQPIPFGRLWWMVPSTLLVLATFSLPRLNSEEELNVKPAHYAVPMWFGFRLAKQTETTVYSRSSGETESTGMFIGLLLGEGNHGCIPFMKIVEQFPAGPRKITVKATVLSNDLINVTVEARIDYRFKNAMQANQAGGPQTVVENITELAKGGIQKSVSGLKAFGNEQNVKSKESRNIIRDGILDGEKAMEIIWGTDIINVSVIDVDLPPEASKAIADGKIAEEHAGTIRMLRKEDVGLSPSEANQASKIVRGFTKETSSLVKHDVGPELGKVMMGIGKVIAEKFFGTPPSGGAERKTSSKEEVPSHKEECSRPDDRL